MEHQEFEFLDGYWDRYGYYVLIFYNLRTGEKSYIPLDVDSLNEMKLHLKYKPHRTYE